MLCSVDVQEPVNMRLQTMPSLYWLCVCVCVCVVTAAYSIQGQTVQIISPSSESHQQVVAVGQPLTAQPQGTVVVSHTHSLSLTLTWKLTMENVLVTYLDIILISPIFILFGCMVILSEC